MPLVVGVTFRKVGKVYYFDPGELELREGDFVIAETARGVEFGEVVLEPREISEAELVAPLKRIVRVATGDDLEHEADNREREKHAFEVCERKIADHKLPMKLLDAECAFDGSQVTFSFSAEGRIDFRELVKDVAGALRAKVQLHQIGVRDEAKLIGGYGTCGRPLCCATFLAGFEPVSMKMAKDQSLFLNPAKFSGACGKLMCCLKYEHDFYRDAQRRLPAVGAIIEVDRGRAKVIDVNMITGILTVETEEEVQLHVRACQINMEGLCRRHGVGCNMTEKNCQPLSAGDYAETVEVADEEESEEDAGLVEDLDVVEIEKMVEQDEAAQRLPDNGVTWRSPGSSPSAGPDKDKPSGGNGSRGSRRRPDRRRSDRPTNPNQPDKRPETGGDTASQ